MISLVLLIIIRPRGCIDRVLGFIVDDCDSLFSPFRVYFQFNLLCILLLLFLHYSTVLL